MCVPEFRNYPELPGNTRNYPGLGVPRETTLLHINKNPIIKHQLKIWVFQELNTTAQRVPAHLLELSITINFNNNDDSYRGPH